MTRPEDMQALLELARDRLMQLGDHGTARFIQEALAPAAPVEEPAADAPKLPPILLSERRIAKREVDRTELHPRAVAWAMALEDAR